ncbi:MAG: effector immunity protein Tgi2PP [Acidobacteriaceae bacterium]
MRRTLLSLTFPAVAAALTLGQPAMHHRLTPSQARRIVVLVARHENIDLSDTHIELNSMDMGADFVPGFSSFIVIRESMTPGPDETLRRYAVNRRTGDVWEINLCTHYDFPELQRMRRTLAGQSADETAQVAAQGRQLGCTQTKSAPAS